MPQACIMRTATRSSAGRDRGQVGFPADGGERGAVDRGAVPLVAGHHAGLARALEHPAPSPTVNRPADVATTAVASAGRPQRRLQPAQCTAPAPGTRVASARTSASELAQVMPAARGDRRELVVVARQAGPPRSAAAAPPRAVSASGQHDPARRGQPGHLARAHQARDEPELRRGEPAQRRRRPRRAARRPAPAPSASRSAVSAHPVAEQRRRRPRRPRPRRPAARRHRVLRPGPAPSPRPLVQEGPRRRDRVPDPLPRPGRAARSRGRPR